MILNLRVRLAQLTVLERGGAVPARTAQTVHSPQKLQRELADLQLVMRARNGDQKALDELIRRYQGFVRLKASSYFLAGGDAEDLIQEGLIGLYKAVRDFSPELSNIPGRPRRTGARRSEAVAASRSRRRRDAKTP